MALDLEKEKINTESFYIENLSFLSLLVLTSVSSDIQGLY